jgi:hypothetical protein
MKRAMKIQAKASKKREEPRALSRDVLAQACTGGIPLGHPPDKEPPTPGIMAGGDPPPKQEPPPG